MFCQHCGNELQSSENEFCSSCGKANANVIKKEPIHWLPIWLYVLGLFFFGVLGGDVLLQEVNIFDYAAAVTWAIAFVLVFQFTPTDRKVLRGFSFALNALGVLSALSWILG